MFTTAAVLLTFDRNLFSYIFFSSGIADYLLTIMTSSRGVRVPFLEQDSFSFSDQDLINLHLSTQQYLSLTRENSTSTQITSVHYLYRYYIQFCSCLILTHNKLQFVRNIQTGSCLGESQQTRWQHHSDEWRVSFTSVLRVSDTKPSGRWRYFQGGGWYLC